VLGVFLSGEMIPKMGIAKNKVVKVTFSLPPKTTMHRTTIYHAITTNSPRFTIQKTPQIAKTPCKNPPRDSQIFFGWLEDLPGYLCAEV
jgi:sRNA-binding carbon storage regulator CsrA